MNPAIRPKSHYQLPHPLGRMFLRGWLVSPHHHSQRFYFIGARHGAKHHVGAVSFAPTAPPGKEPGWAQLQNVPKAISY